VKASNQVGDKGNLWSIEMKDEELTFRKVEGVELVEVPDGWVIYNETLKRVILLNLTAAAMLELCDGESGATRIAMRMQEIFRLSEPPQSDVEGCLRSLISEGLVEIRSSRNSLLFRFKRRVSEAIRSWLTA
jgi:Coenzyme PQQ synthesis protein D (PqqD)